MKLLRDLVLRSVPVVHPSTSLAETMELMEEEPLKVVAIVGDEQFMGMYTAADRDSGRVPAGADLDELAVGPYISAVKVLGSPEMTVEETRERMARHGIAVLPVVANRTFKGVLVADDLV